MFQSSNAEFWFDQQKGVLTKWKDARTKIKRGRSSATKFWWTNQKGSKRHGLTLVLSDHLYSMSPSRSSPLFLDNFRRETNGFPHPCYSLPVTCSTRFFWELDARFFNLHHELWKVRDWELVQVFMLTIPANQSFTLPFVQGQAAISSSYNVQQPAQTHVKPQFHPTSRCSSHQ